MTSRVPPSSAGGVVRRSALLERLSVATQGPLTVVSAPAGSGKTVLVADWARSCAGSARVVWVTLEAIHREPLTFWTALARGLETHARVGPPLPSRLADEVASSETTTILVLDAGDVLGEGLLGAELDAFVTRCGDRLRTVVLTRALPHLPLHRRRLDGSATELRADDLAFTLEETRELVRITGGDLAEDDLRSLHRRTRGWAAGLRFALSGLLLDRREAHEALGRFTGADGAVAEFLIEEVLEAQPPHVREFLIATCVVDRLTPGVVVALTEDDRARQVLAFLARGSAFIEVVEGAPATYRYQPLFREFLRARLSFEQPALAGALHQRAAAWFAQADLPVEAIEHARAAGDWELLATCVVEAFVLVPLLSRQPTSRDARLLHLLPEGVLGVPAALLRAAAAVDQLDPVRALAELDTARAPALAGRPQCHTVRLTHALLETLAALQGVDTGRVGPALVAAEQALDAMPLHVLADHPEARAHVGLLQGKHLMRSGDLVGASRALGAAATWASSPGCEELLVECLGFAALAAAVDGRPVQADELGSRCVAVPSGASPRTRSWVADLAGAWSSSTSGDPAGGWSRAARAEAGAAGGNDAWLRPALVLVRARLWESEGNGARAAELLRETAQTLDAEQAHIWPGRAVTGTDPEEHPLAGRPADGRREGGHEGVLVSPLTPRELDVLMLLADLLNTDEIAAELFVSVNTVRTHVRSILAKLGAGRRNEAVRRAWDLEILPRRAERPVPVVAGRVVRAG